MLENIKYKYFTFYDEFIPLVEKMPLSDVKDISKFCGNSFTTDKYSIYLLWFYASLEGREEEHNGCTVTRCLNEAR